MGTEKSRGYRARSGVRAIVQAIAALSSDLKFMLDVVVQPIVPALRK